MDVILILLMIGLLIVGVDLLLEYSFGSGNKTERHKKQFRNSLIAFAGAALCLILVMSGGKEAEKPDQAKSERIRADANKSEKKAKKARAQHIAQEKRERDQRLAREKQKRTDADSFQKGMEYFIEGKYSRASKYLSRVDANSHFADTTKFYLYIANNEKSLKHGAKIWIKSNRANVRELPRKNAKIKTVLPEETELQYCYEYEKWTRIYRRGENNWIFADVPEVNGWIHSSLIENREAHKKTLVRKRKEREIEKEKEEVRRKEKERENLAKFLPWQIHFFSQYGNIVSNIEPMSMDSIIMVKIYVNSFNQIVIENIGIEAAYGLKRVFGRDHHIAIYLAVGRSNVAEVRWSSFSQEYICEFND